MARYGVELLTQPERASGMGEAGRTHALSHFNRDAIVEKYESLYDQIVEGRKAGLMPC